LRLAGQEFIFLAVVFAAAALIFIFFRVWRVRKAVFSNTASASKASAPGFLVYLPDILKAAAVFLFVAALLRPQLVKEETTEKMEGIDIILALDISGSMQANDLKPNRLEAAKDVLRKFVSGLSGDRVGLVVFAGTSFSQCPLTIDYEIVNNFINRVDFQTIRIDGTAIGDAIITSVNRLEAAPAGSDKLLILATDGVNNRGVNPMEAAKIAAVKKVKVYTIGIGKKGGATMSFVDRFGIPRQVSYEEPDEQLLKAMAAAAGGRYFRAEDEKKLGEIYDTIARLEKREREVKRYDRYEELFGYLLWAGIILLGAAMMIEAVRGVRLLA